MQGDVVVVKPGGLGHVCSHSLPVLLQLSVHPAVPLVGDEQHDDVSLVEAEQRVVVAGRVGEDGAHARPLHDVVEARGHRHRPGQVVVLAVHEVWEEGGRRGEDEEAQQGYLTYLLMTSRHDGDFINLAKEWI